jgi:hypothetical protein
LGAAASAAPGVVAPATTSGVELNFAPPDSAGERRGSAGRVATLSIATQHAHALAHNKPTDGACQEQSPLLSAFNMPVQMPQATAPSALGCWQLIVSSSMPSMPELSVVVLL